MNFGAHISIKGGIENAPRRAHNIGCECFQMFSRSPQGGNFPVITDTAVGKFKKECKKYRLDRYFIHSPYYINLASANSRIYYGSIAAIRNELMFADRIGAMAVVTHLGSARGLGMNEARKKLVRGIVKIFVPEASGEKTEKKETAYSARLLIEITAGAGEIMGDTFEEIGYFISEAEKCLKKNVLGVCFDTAHAFASGYNLRDKMAVENTFSKFDRIIGLERLGLVHCNDSRADLNSHIDRHDNIGKGKIGLEGFRAILNYEWLKNMDFIAETPGGTEKEDLITLRRLCNKKHRKKQ